MTQDQKFLAIGVYLHGGLYLSAVFVSALAAANRRARDAAIFAMGLTYLGYFAQLLDIPRAAQLAAVGLSLLAGAAAGLLLVM